MNIFQMSLRIPLSFAVHLKAADAARLLGPRRLTRCPKEWDGGSFGFAVFGGGPHRTKVMPPGPAQCRVA